jgi:tetratricopeptide (TPR) repeat protein
MCKINLHTFLLALVVSIASVQASAGSTELRSDDTTRNYWVPQNPPKAHYKIECSIDPVKGLLEGTEVICFRNTTSKPIHRLKILWTSFGSMEITSNKRQVAVLAETKECVESSTVIEFPEPIRPNEKTTLQIKYTTLAPDYLRGEEIRLPSFYPQLWWGYSTHNSFEVRIDIPLEYILATSGVLDHRTGYYHAENVCRFGLFLGKGHKVIEAKAKDVLVQVVYKADAEECARLVLKTAVDVISFYQQRFGFYPSTCLTIIPGMSRPAGGYPVATNIVAVHGMEQLDSMPKYHWQWITAHEIGHQYCGEHILSKDPADSFDWLMIGLGIYADREYTQARNLSLAKHQGLMDRYVKGVRAGLDTTINITPEQRSKIQFDFNNVVEHGKSYSVISTLDCVLGKKVFDRIYKRCLKEFGGKRLGVHEFQAVCEDESGQDLGWFFEQWVNSNKYLSYEIFSKKCERKGDCYISEVEVKCLGDLKMPVPVAAYFEDGTRQIKFTDRLLDTNMLVFESMSKLKDARLDPNNELAMVIPPPAPNEAQLTGMVKDLPWTGAGKKALNVFKKAEEGKMTNADSWFKLGLTLYDGHYYKEALVAFRHTHELAEKTSNRYLASLVWHGHILDLLGRRQEALNYYEEVLIAGKDFGMRHDQYGIKINKDWVKERIKKPFER